MKSPGPNPPLLIRSLSFVIIDLLAPNCMERTTARKENILTGELYLPKLMKRHLKRSKARQDSRPCLLNTCRALLPQVKGEVHFSG